ncbi:MAG: hypothetical protein U0L58_08675 [Ruminococcus sp.]|nr:hypothetical protein [Ruminococcus sp.]
MANSILNKVCFLLDKANSKKYTKTDLNTIIDYTKEFSNDLILGRVFGYSVGAYAMATLNWINDPVTGKEYDTLLKNLTQQQREEVEELIKKELYLQWSQS